ILTAISQLKFCRRNRFNIPVNFVEPFHTTVQVLTIVVFSQRVRCAVKSELSFGNAVPISSDDRTKVRRGLQVALQLIISKDDVVKFSGRIRSLQVRYDSTIVDDVNL